MGKATKEERMAREAAERLAQERRTVLNSRTSRDPRAAFLARWDFRRKHNDEGKLLLQRTAIPVATAKELLAQAVGLLAKFATVERLLNNSPTLVAQGATIAQFDYSARPRSGLDTGQRGAMKDAVAGKRTLTQQEEDDKRAHLLVEEAKKRKLKDDEILVIQNALNAAQKLVRFNPDAMRKRRELRDGFEYKDS